MRSHAATIFLILSVSSNGKDFAVGNTSVSESVGNLQRPVSPGFMRGCFSGVGKASGVPSPRYNQPHSQPSAQPGYEKTGSQVQVIKRGSPPFLQPAPPSWGPHLPSQLDLGPLPLQPPHHLLGSALREHNGGRDAQLPSGVSSSDARVAPCGDSREWGAVASSASAC